VVAELVERLAVAAVEDVGVEAEDVLEFEVDGFGFVGFPATRLRRLPRSTGLAGRTPRAFRGLRGYGRSRRGRRRQANLVLWAVSTPRCVGASGRRRIHTVYFWREIWRPALELAGLDYYRAPYNLRHTFAYWSLRAGVPIAAVARDMGHETTEHTFRMYGGWCLEVGADTARLRSAWAETTAARDSDATNSTEPQHRSQSQHPSPTRVTCVADWNRAP